MIPSNFDYSSKSRGIDGRAVLKESGVRRGGGGLVRELGAAGVGVRLGRGWWWYHHRHLRARWLHDPDLVGLLLNAPRPLPRPRVGDDLDLPDHAAVARDRGDPAYDPLVPYDEELAIALLVQTVPDSPDRMVTGELLGHLAEHEPAVGTAPLVHVRLATGRGSGHRDLPRILRLGLDPPHDQVGHEGHEHDQNGPRGRNDVRRFHEIERAIHLVQVLSVGLTPLYFSTALATRYLWTRSVKRAKIWHYSIRKRVSIPYIKGLVKRRIVCYYCSIVPLFLSYSMSFLYKILGDPNKKTIATLQPTVDKINSLETQFLALSNEELKSKTNEFRERLTKGEALNDLLPEAFAVVREASKRTTGMRHFDVQLIGGIALHQGKIAEMRTGEGKTLVATLPLYLNALHGKGVHLVTVNDYLARRDAVWMGQIYDALGMSVGVVQNLRVSYVYDKNAEFKMQNAELADEKTSEGGEIDTERDEMGSFKVEYDYLRPASRQEAYRCDITYGTNNEFGFDYLRDNMVQSIEEMVMRPGTEMQYAIVDEVDSILIDEARTPLIISAPAEEATEQYYQFARWVKQLKENDPSNPSGQGDYNVDEKLRSATLTEAGIHKFEEWLGVENLYVEGGIRLIHHIEQALKAEVLFKLDRDYIVDNGEVIIIDEFTGRKMEGRRYSEGLHQAIEAKEGVDIQRESQTLATITFQNLFRMYGKLAGMTGTASTEAEEFGKIYGLEVLVIPTNKPDQRTDRQDRIYKTEEAKYSAVVERIKECRDKLQPILVGTISVQKNEQLSAYLTASGIPHEVLNAKNHEREGEIIAQAGRPGAVTLATNMAGRGVDIKLGGVPADPADTKKVIDAGGLFVLGTERHESRRIDNQLRGRAARQGDPGETQFLVSTEDDLMRIFAGERLKSVMTRLKVPDNMPIEQKMITRLLESAQKKVESHNFDIRKHLLEYDDVLNKQRTVIYQKRRQVLERSRPTKEMIRELVEQEIEFIVLFHTHPKDVETGVELEDGRGEWDIDEIYQTINTVFSLTEVDRASLQELGKRGADNREDVESRDRLVKFLIEKAEGAYGELEETIVQKGGGGESGEKLMREVEKGVLLRVIDSLWVDYLVAMDYLRNSIGLRGYGQRDPLIEYKKESFLLFNQLVSDIQKEVVYTFFKVGVGIQLAPTIMATDKLTLKGAEKTADNGASEKPRNAEGNKVGRNDPCPCGSGKKFKRCHGA